MRLFTVNLNRVSYPKNRIRRILKTLALFVVCISLFVVLSAANVLPLKKDNVSQSQQDAMMTIAEQLCPAVVYIENISTDDEGQSAPVGSGSGVIISKHGYIITNYHVIAGANDVYVYLADGRYGIAELIGSDSSVDLALLKTDLTDLPVAEFGNSDDLAIGQFAFAIGNPGGAQFARSMTMGVISGLNREIELEDGNIYNLIQTDAAINPGNSGGPLVNIDGEVIGITSVKIVDTNFEGMGFAIPINTVVEVIEELAVPISTIQGN